MLFFKYYLNLKVVGRKNIPKTGPFIFASNHASYLDPILLGVSLHRSLNYMARDTLFREGSFAWILKRLHVFPVRRQVGDFRAIKESIDILKSGKPLVIFPEGTRSDDGELKTGKPGIGFIAMKAKVPILPAYIEGSFKALPKGMSTLRRHPVRVYIGRPVDIDFEKKDKAMYQHISDEIMRRIAFLKELHNR